MDDGNIADKISSLFDVREILTHLESEGVLAVLLAAFYWTSRRLSIWFTIPPLRKAYGAIAICFLALAVLPARGDRIYQLASYVVATAVLALAMRSIFKGFEDIGLGAAFLSTKQGVGFEKSLKMAKVSLDFLGIGQVRFYPLHKEKDWQIFRLMFLNNTVCLWSWTVWGPHLGAENPQVVLINRDANSQTGTFNAFRDYFIRLWEDPAVQKVDLAEYHGGRSDPGRINPRQVSTIP